MTAFQLTSRDYEILNALQDKVRLFALRQLANHWFSGEVANARRRMKLLSAGGLVQPISVVARTLPDIAGPIVSWQPGRPAPDFGAVSHELTHRWSGRAARTVAAYLATARASQLLGGPSRNLLSHPTQSTHDLGVAAVWLQLHRRAPHWAAAWRNEDVMAATRRGEKLPDAFLVDQQDQPFGVIEFGGDGGGYGKTRVRDFHDDCAARSLPYQIW